MNNESNENYDAGVEVNSYYLGPETGKVEVYRRYLKNLNYTSAKNLSDSAIFHDYAKMLFAVNGSLNVDENAIGDMNSEHLPKTFAAFSVANSEVVLILLTVIYLIIFVLGVLGNVVTCIVIAKNKSMHTVVNYYLFSLAVSDLLLLICGKILKCLILLYLRLP